MNARKKYRVGFLQRRAYLSGLLLDSIKRNGSGTLADFVARFPNFTASETKRALDYLHEVNIIQRVSKEYGTLWVFERKDRVAVKKDEWEREYGNKRSMFQEYTDQAAHLIARAESKPDRWERQEKALAKFGWSRNSITSCDLRRQTALRCLLHFGIRWVGVNDVAEKIGGVGHNWLPVLRSLVADGIISMKYETINGRHTCLYRRPSLHENDVETPRAYKRHLVTGAISNEWQDIYSMAEKIKVSEQYVRYVLKGLEKEGFVEKRVLTGVPHLWRWKKGQRGDEISRLAR